VCGDCFVDAFRRFLVGFGWFPSAREDRRVGGNKDVPRLIPEFYDKACLVTGITARVGMLRARI
jgi:hypothetical protein